MSVRKIAIIDHVGSKAGLDYYSSSLALGLNAQGAEVYIVSNFPLKSKGIHSYPYFSGHLNSSISKLINHVIAFFLAGYRCRVSGCREAIVHSFSFRPKDLYAMLILRFWGLKLINIVHDIEGFEDSDRSWIRNVILRTLSKNLVVHNDFSLNKLLQIDSSLKEKVTVLKHGHFHALPLPHPNREEARTLLGLDQDTYYILFFGQIKAVKGLDLLIEGFAKSGIDAKLIIAGKPWKADFQKNETLASELGIDSKIIKYIRFIEDTERDLFFKACNLLVLPYRKIYQSGVLLMAISYRIPVIASNLEPNKDLIQHESTGRLFISEDAESLAAELKIAYHNRDEMEEFAEKGYARTAFEYDWKKIAKGYLQL